MAVSKNDRRIMLETMIKGLTYELEQTSRLQKKALRRIRRTDISDRRHRKLKQDLNVLNGELYSCEKRLKYAEQVFSQLF